jgi:hypothetical protein
MHPTTDRAQCDRQWATSMCARRYLRIQYTQMLARACAVAPPTGSQWEPLTWMSGVATASSGNWRVCCTCSALWARSHRKLTSLQCRDTTHRGSLLTLHKLKCIVSGRSWHPNAMQTCKANTQLLRLRCSMVSSATYLGPEGLRWNAASEALESWPDSLSQSDIFCRDTRDTTTG